VVRREPHINFQRTLSLAEFVKSGFRVDKNLPIFGTIMTNILLCDRNGCHFDEPEKLNTLSLNVLHAFKLLIPKSSDKQDYRSIPFSLDQSSEIPVLLTGARVPFHVFSFEQGSNGLLKGRLSACANPLINVEKCLNSPDGNLKTVVNFDLENLKRVTFNSLQR
jgi:hypothetical protein